MSVHLLDVGSTSIKYAAYDPDTRTRGGERALPFPPPARQDSPYYEVEAEAIVRGVEELLEPAREGDEIRVCVQMHGYLLCDREGRALSRYISWRDRRSLLVPEGERYPFELPPTRGVARKSNLPLAGLCMMRRAAQFCTLGSYSNAGAPVMMPPSLPLARTASPTRRMALQIGSSSPRQPSGVTWSERHIVPVRDFETDEKQAIRTYHGKPLRFFWNVSRVFFKGDDCYSALIKYTYRPDDVLHASEGVLLRCAGLDRDPDRAAWETLPDGKRGLRAPQGGGRVSEEQSYVMLSDGTIFAVYRTIDGHPACALALAEPGHRGDSGREAGLRPVARERAGIRPGAHDVGGGVALSKGVSAMSAGTRNAGGRALCRRILKNYELYLFLLPAIVYFFLFCYLPMDSMRMDTSSSPSS